MRFPQASLSPSWKWPQFSQEAVAAPNWREAKEKGTRDI